MKLHWGHFRLLAILFSALGAFMSRWHGGGFISNTPKILKNFLWALPFSAATGWLWWHDFDGVDHTARIGRMLEPYLGYFPYWVFWAVPLAVALIALGMGMAGKGTGHGMYMSLARAIKLIDPERLDFLVRLVFDRDPRDRSLGGDMVAIQRRIDAYGERRLYWRCVFGLAVVGFSAVSGAAVLIGIIDPVAGLIIALGGMGKAPAYAIGRLIIGDRPKGEGDLDDPTELGEVFTGALAFAGLALGVWKAV